MDYFQLYLALVIYLETTLDCQFTYSPTEVQGCEHSAVRISWDITDYETVKYVTWKKGDNTIMTQIGSMSATSIDDNIKHGGNGEIIIEGVQPEDAGVYTCVVTSASDYVFSSTATLHIVVAPSYPPVLKSTMEGKNINHICVVGTKGTPKVYISIQIGALEKPTDTYAVPIDNQEEISCCITGDAVECLSLVNVTKKTCIKVKNGTTIESVTYTVTEENDLDTGQIFGIVIGSVILVAILSVVAIVIIKIIRSRIRNHDY